MSIEWISILIIVAMLGLMALGLPLAWSIGAVAVALVFYKFDPSVMVMLVSRVFDMSLNYTLMSVPLFVLMAGILQRSGVANQLFRAVNVWAGGVRGGHCHRHHHRQCHHGFHGGHHRRRDRHLRPHRPP